jgi:hypothetical protein
MGERRYSLREAMRLAGLSDYGNFNRWLARAGITPEIITFQDGGVARGKYVSRAQIDELVAFRATFPHLGSTHRSVTPLYLSAPEPAAMPLAESPATIWSYTSPVTRPITQSVEARTLALAELPAGSMPFPDWLRRHHIVLKTGREAIGKRLLRERGDVEFVKINNVPTWVISALGQSRAYALWGTGRYGPFQRCAACPHLLLAAPVLPHDGDTDNAGDAGDAGDNGDNGDNNHTYPSAIRALSPGDTAADG